MNHHLITLAEPLIFKNYFGPLQIYFSLISQTDSYKSYPYYNIKDIKQKPKN